MRRPAVATTPNDVKIAAVGDSITYGLSTEEVVPYPEVLSQLLDDTFGAGHFAVTNLGYVRRSQRRAPHPHDTPPVPLPAPSPPSPRHRTGLCSDVIHSFAAPSAVPTDARPLRRGGSRG